MHACDMICRANLTCTHTVQVQVQHMYAKCLPCMYTQNTSGLQKDADKELDLCTLVI